MPRTAVACARAWMVLLRSCMDACRPARCARRECELSARRKQGYGREMSRTLQPCNGIVALGRECGAFAGVVSSTARCWRRRDMVRKGVGYAAMTVFLLSVLSGAMAGAQSRLNDKD